MEEQDNKSWFSRNWIWVVPTGGCLLFIIGVLVLAGGLVWGVSNMVSDSDTYQVAMEQAQNNQMVIDLLGEPIEKNGMTSANIQWNNGTKTSELGIPIKGPEGKAIIYVEGIARGEKWEYQVMEVYIADTDTTIDLLPLQELPE